MQSRAGQGAPEGLWIRAERQTAGRGRLGRKWEGQTGNLYASTLVRLNTDDPPPATLAFVTGIAVHRVIRAYVPKGSVELKWPNDVLVDGKKICGMLLERVGDAIIVGIGVNITNAPEIAGREVTYMHRQGASTSLNADILVTELADSFLAACHEWRAQPLSMLLDNWSANAHKIGTEITVSQNQNDRISGQFAGLSQDGSLKLRTDDGQVHIIHAGDVEIVRDMER